jgi:membrane protein YqaA with SNARE-associated domain
MAVEPERPTFPWVQLIVIVAVGVLAVSFIGWVLSTVWWLIKVAAVIVVIGALVSWAVGHKADRHA